ncbi:hypothetical protein C8J57DRAFT_1583117 [Mycena rebaudengoi]|nr:hypothetical protein C8J57DRAFT_1583117 [Mycena rebaudengoi]
MSPPAMYFTQSNLPVAQSSALPFVEVAQPTVSQVSSPALSTNIPATTNHIRDHSTSSQVDWPTGYIRRRCIAGAEERKWKKNKWVWRSNGTAQHAGHEAEVRVCMGVLKCSTCGCLSRPHTQAAARKDQFKEGCKSRTCLLGAPLLHDQCDARSFHYSTDCNGVSINVWEHNGDHASHERPPGGALSKFEEEQVDLQVLRKLEANAHQLRTGDIGPGSIPLSDISSGLAGPRSARYQLAQSQVRLGLGTGPAKGGLALMGSFADRSILLFKRHSWTVSLKKLFSPG